MIAKWLNTEPKILVLDEPTRGIDVGAKADVHRLVDDLARSGMAVILISSDLPEVLAMSDRILVMREGHQAATLDVRRVRPGAGDDRRRGWPVTSTVTESVLNDQPPPDARPRSSWLGPERVKELSLVGLIVVVVDPVQHGDRQLPRGPVVQSDRDQRGDHGAARRR